MNYQQELQNQKVTYAHQDSDLFKDSESQQKYLNNLPKHLLTMPGFMVLDNLETHVKSERKLMHVILAHIYAVHSRKLYFERGFSSTYEYLRSLGYSESPAYERIRAAELLGVIPEVTEKLKSGSVNLTQLNHVQRMIRQKKDSGEYVTLEQTANLIELIENKSSFETKKLLAQELNLPVVEETRIKPQSNNTVRIEMSISDEDLKEVEKAKSHLSHIFPNGEIEKIFMKSIRELNKKFEGKSEAKDEAKPKSEKFEERPSKKLTKSKKPKKEAEYSAESAYAFDPSRDLSEEDLVLNEKLITRHLLLAAGKAGATIKNNNRKHIPITVKRKIFAKANYTCEHVEAKTGRKCISKYQLQVDHVLSPKSKNNFS